MAFFSQKKLQRRKIEIDESAITSDSAEVRQRLDRIQDNYLRLDTMLAEVESKIQGDERLSAIDQTIKDEELQLRRKKKKWRARKSKASKRKSANPKKPR